MHAAVSGVSDQILGGSNLAGFGSCIPLSNDMNE